MTIIFGHPGHIGSKSTSLTSKKTATFFYNFDFFIWFSSHFLKKLSSKISKKTVVLYITLNL